MKNLLLLLISTISIPSFAAIVYDESVSGSLSSNGLSPTAVALALGSNQILGSNGAGAPAVRDYLTFTIPVNMQLNSLTMLTTTPLGLKGFIGLEAGNQLTLLPSTMTAAGLLGWWHYVPGDAGSDLLPLMGAPANGSSGFSAPLGAGTYTLWIQDSSTGTFNYGFDLLVAPTPEPATWMASVMGIGCLLAVRRGHGAKKRA